MGYTAAPLEKLIEQFSQFPGIGRKGATRMAYQVLSMSDADAAALAEAIQNAHTRLHRCRVCQNYTEAELCPICSSAKRDRSTICVVETPRDGAIDAIRPGPDEVLMLQLSGGSTGLPKVIPRLHGEYMAYVASWDRLLGLGPDDVHLW